MLSEEITIIIQRAIRGEEDSHRLYTTAQDMIKDPAAKTTLKDLAEQELGHKAKLEALLRGSVPLAVAASKKGQVKDLQIGEFLELKPLTAESDLQDILIVAMKREEATGAFYSQMAELLEPGPARELFEMLAKEEIKHKLYVEQIYEEVVYRDF